MLFFVVKLFVFSTLDVSPSRFPQTHMRLSPCDILAISLENKQTILHETCGYPQLGKKAKAKPAKKTTSNPMSSNLLMSLLSAEALAELNAVFDRNLKAYAEEFVLKRIQEMTVKKEQTQVEIEEEEETEEEKEKDQLLPLPQPQQQQQQQQQQEQEQEKEEEEEEQQEEEEEEQQEEEEEEQEDQEEAEETDTKEPRPKRQKTQGPSYSCYRIEKKITNKLIQWHATETASPHFDATQAFTYPYIVQNILFLAHKPENVRNSVRSLPHLFYERTSRHHKRQYEVFLIGQAAQKHASETLLSLLSPPTTPPLTQSRDFGS